MYSLLLSAVLDPACCLLSPLTAACCLRCCLLFFYLCCVRLSVCLFVCPFYALICAFRRRPLWRALVHDRVRDIRARVGRSYYPRLARSYRSQRHSQIELDLLRTFPFNKFFQGPQSRGVIKLRRVLTAFARHNPTVEYCQGFNYIAGFALIFLSEEDAFWCVDRPRIAGTRAEYRCTDSAVPSLPS